MKACNYSHQIYSSLDQYPDASGQVSKDVGQPRLKHCPPPVGAFTGRGDILAQMREFFFDHSWKRHVFVLHGLGGAGKTQIALKFVEICQVGTVPRFFRLFLFSCICILELILLPS